MFEVPPRLQHALSDRRTPSARSQAAERDVEARSSWRPTCAIAQRAA